MLSQVRLYLSNFLANTSSSGEEALDTVRSLDRVCSLGANLRYELLTSGCSELHQAATGYFACLKYPAFLNIQGCPTPHLGRILNCNPISLGRTAPKPRELCHLQPENPQISQIFADFLFLICVICEICGLVFLQRKVDKDLSAGGLVVEGDSAVHPHHNRLHNG